MEIDTKLLKDLCMIPSPSNNEGGVVKFLEELPIKNFKFKKSKKNAACFSIDKGHDKTILLDAHIDQVHLRVLRTTEDGHVVASPVGFEPIVLDGDTVIHFESGIKGSVMTLPPHLDIEDRPAEEVYIDFGMNGREIKKAIKVGDIIIFNTDFYIMNKKNIVCSGLDNKAGAFVLIELLRYFDKNIDKLSCNLVLHFSSREETGMGSFANIMHMKIDEIIVLDTDFVTSSNLIDPDLVGIIESEKGPIITRNYEDDVSMSKKFMEIAKKNRIPYQLSYSSKFGGSNNSFYTQFFDSLTQFIGIPLKNMHSPNEIVNINDLKYTFKLLAKYISK